MSSETDSTGTAQETVQGNVRGDTQGDARGDAPPRQIRFFTMCMRRDAAQALLLCESVVEHHPAAHATIWLLDEGPRPKALDQASKIETRAVSELFADDALARYWLRYDEADVLEATQPACFERHFADGDEIVIYLSAYSLVYRPFTELLVLLEQGAAGVLTPLLTTPRHAPAPQAGPADVVGHGRVLNLDLVALRAAPSARALLAWWRDWFEGLQQVEAGNDLAAFMQQFDSAPYLWPDLRVLDHSGYQVACWNLVERALATRADGSVELNGAPLTSLYFGRLTSTEPRRLTCDLSACAANGQPVLAPLVDAYQRAALAHGYLECQLLHRQPLTFDDGCRFDMVCYEACRVAIKQGITFTSLRGLEPGSFREWLRKYEIGRRFPHYIEVLFEMRSDVYAAFGQGSVDEVMVWIREYGVRENDLLPALLEPPRGERGERQPIAYLGYLTSELGLGEAARGYIAALQRQGYSVDMVDISDIAYHKRSDAYVKDASLSGVLPGGVKILHVNADTLLKVIERIPEPTRAGSYKIGVWAWETLDFPEEWSDRFALLDEVWVGSQFMARAISPKSPIPVVVMPHVISVPPPQPDRAFFGLDPNEFVYLLSFDFSSVRERKNPVGAIQAFMRAFSPDEPVRLFVKSMHGDRFPDQYLTMREAAEGARVTFYDGTLSNAQRHALLSSCDAYLSLHRAEGFGLGLAECMALGKPVVATGWSGNMEFMSHQNSALVDYQLKPLAALAGPYPAGTIWAEPDLDDAARKMRALWLDQQWRERLVKQAQRDMQDGFSAEVVGKLLSARLERIEQRAGQRMAQAHAPLQPTAAQPTRRAPGYLKRKGLGAARRAKRVIKAALT